MGERQGVITFKGNPLTLLGKEPRIGEQAPNATLLANDLSEIEVSSFRGRVCVVVAVPSLDTPVCDTEARRFNQEAGKLGPNVVVLGISMDLPFAQKRWCGAAGVENVQTLSDHREASFGEAYGVLIKELRLLARSVFVIDRNGILRYSQIVKEVTDEPEYEEVLQAVSRALGA
jgi:thiol peroxidase